MRRLFKRQIAKATSASGEVDLERLEELVVEAYGEADRDRRRTDHSLGLMAEELQQKNGRLLALVGELETRERLLLQRAEQLTKAQKIGRFGDWTYSFGASQPWWWSPQVNELLGRDAAAPAPDPEEAMAIIGEAATAPMLEAQAAIMRTRQPASFDARVKTLDGSVRDFAVTMEPMFDDIDQIVGIAGTTQDITDRKNAQRELERLAYYDPLTGLANRAMFHRELNDTLTRYGKSGTQAALLLLDLDRFKEVNDALGHAAGDQLLQKVAQTFSRVLGGRHFLSRLGGDEFAIILAEYQGRSLIEDLAAEMVAMLSGSFQLGSNEVVIGASIGIALIPTDGANAVDLQRHADLALYRAKQNGRNRFEFFEPAMSAAVMQKIVLAHDLRQALTHEGELFLNYQPQVSLQRGRVVGYEALVRWSHPKLGNVPPSEFIPIAESSQLICDLGLFVLRTAVNQAKAWLDQGLSDCPISVNVSAAQIWHTNFASDVESVLAQTGLPARLLCLELTESLLVDHAEGRIRSVLGELKRLGVTLALDDFGTDYSSLGYLTQLPFDKLKIDRVFIDGVVESERAQNLLGGIIALGRGLGMTTIAEGAERPEEVTILRQLNCDIVQGYVFARPTEAAGALSFAKSLEGTLPPLARAHSRRLGAAN